MTVIVHKNKSIKDIVTLDQVLLKSVTNPRITDPAIKLESDKEAESLNLLIKENYIRDQLKVDKKFEAWAPVVFYGYKTDVVIDTEAALVSTSGKIAYDVDGELHIASGDFAEEYPTVSIPALKGIYDYPLGISRIVASTFLSVPDKYKGISQHDLEVIHLNGQSHQSHVANLEWSLNKPKDEISVIEETVKALNTDLPTEE